MLYSVMAASVKQKQVATTFPHTATIVSSGKLAYCIKETYSSMVQQITPSFSNNAVV